MKLIRKGELGVTYDFRDAKCIGRECFAPGHFEHRGATSSGYRSTGASTPCCMTRAYHGCPRGVDDPKSFELDRARKQKADGWSNVR